MILVTYLFGSRVILTIVFLLGSSRGVYVHSLLFLEILEYIKFMVN